MITLPEFRYHPDPVGTRRVRIDDSVCASCGVPRGAAFDLWDWSDHPDGDHFKVHHVCPWCIADGTASRRLGVPFCSDEMIATLAAAGAPRDALEEIRFRTPGVNSWQGSLWIPCCADACAFYGDASREELGMIGGAALERLLAEFVYEESDWCEFLRDYEQGGNPTALKFRCTHCGDIKYYLDCT
jgi:uncharacterized protein CbrC (UPF0167 family)